MYRADLRDAVVDELLRWTEVRPDRSVPSWVVRHRAEDLDIAESTIWRWLREAVASGPSRPTRKHPDLEDRHVEVIVGCGGNLTRAKEKLDQDDPAIAAMSSRTFRRRWAEQPPDVQAVAVGGIEAAMKYHLRLVYEAPERNHVWHVDHQELPIWIIPEGGRSRVKPWMTTVIDDFSRRIMATMLTVERPNTETLVLTIASGVRIRTDNGIQVGGVPVELHSDNGGEFKSVGYRQALAALGVQRTTTYPFMKHQNGKAERVQQTIQGFVAGLIGYAHAPKSLSKKDLFGADGPILTEETFRELLSNWIDEYNNDRVHSSIGTTPNARWASETGPLRIPDEDALRMAMLSADKPRKVQQRGVFFKNSYYTSAQLAPWIGREVQVRYFPAEDRVVEVFDLKGNWITTATNQAMLTEPQVDQIRQQSQKGLTDVRQLQRRAAERRRAEALADPKLAAGIALDHDQPTVDAIQGGIGDYLDYVDEGREAAVEDTDDRAKTAAKDKAKTAAKKRIGDELKKNAKKAGKVEIEAEADEIDVAEGDEGVE